MVCARDALVAQLAPSPPFAIPRVLPDKRIAEDVVFVYIF
jgi:hypothetical protein